MSIQDFEILQELGQGSFSKVFKVWRKSDHQFYALKKVSLKNMNTKEKSNALNEVRILASINHPNIISYKEAFYDDDSDSLCLVMEYAEGGDLLQKIIDHKVKQSYMNEEFLWNLLIEISQGLEALHSLGIIHRDIKSANILITRDGNIKIGDLNVSKVTKEGLNHTQTGTPYYASPEIWKHEPYDFKTDIWSLGCVLYEAAALKLPFLGKDMKCLMKRISKGAFYPLPSCYSLEFSELFTYFLSVDPKKRPKARQILKMHCVKKRNSLKDNKKDIWMGLIDKINIPSNISSVSICFPLPNYNSRRSNSERLNIKSPLPKVHVSNNDKRKKEAKSVDLKEQIKERRINHRRNNSIDKCGPTRLSKRKGIIHSMHEELLNQYIRNIEDVLPRQITERKIRRQ